MTTDILDAPIRDLLARIAAPAAGATPDLAAIGAALADLAADPEYFAPWIDRLGDRSGSLPIHAPDRGARLTLVHRTDGQMSAVHSHGTWVAISPVAGRETHRRWRVRRSGGGAVPTVELDEDRLLAATETATLLPPDDVHDHGHLLGRGEPGYVLVLLGDDQTRFAREEWDLATGRHRILRPGDPGRWLASEPMP